MNFLYHRVPPNMQGNVLYPLNQLKDIYQKVYEEAVKKYKGREFVREQRIPPLNCLWNDVLHLTAVHPSDLRKAFKKAEVPLRKLKFFEINPLNLDNDKTKIWLYRNLPRHETHKESEFVDFNPEELEDYSRIQEQTIEYYRQEHRQGRKRLLFHLVLHILYKGEINIENCQIVEA